MIRSTGILSSVPPSEIVLSYIHMICMIMDRLVSLCRISIPTNILGSCRCRARVARNNINYPLGWNISDALLGPIHRDANDEANAPIFQVFVRFLEPTFTYLLRCELVACADVINLFEAAIYPLKWSAGRAEYIVYIFVEVSILLKFPGKQQSDSVPCI